MEIQTLHFKKKKVCISQFRALIKWHSEGEGEMKSYDVFCSHVHPNLGEVVHGLPYGDYRVICHRAAYLFFPTAMPLPGQLQTPFFHDFHISNYSVIGSSIQSPSSLPFVITKSGKESRLIAVPSLDLWLIQFSAPLSNSHRVFPG